MLFVPINSENIIVDIEKAEVNVSSLLNCTASGIVTIENGEVEVEIPYTFA